MPPRCSRDRGGAHGIRPEAIRPAGACRWRLRVWIIARWTSYRVINFDYARSDLSASDKSTVAEIATYMTRNPSLQVGLDGYRDPTNPSLSDRRVGSVRDALIVAGVPSSKVQVGAFGDPLASRDRRVEVLLSSGAGPISMR